MNVKQFRLSSQAKDQLVKLKRFTGIQHWNVLCRWAFCLSLAEKSAPTPIEIPSDSNVEMSWAVFAGEYHEVYLALLIERCVADGVPLTRESLQKQLRLHIHRGIGYLATPNKIRSIADLISIGAQNVRKLHLPMQRHRNCIQEHRTASDQRL